MTEVWTVTLSRLLLCSCSCSGPQVSSCSEWRCCSCTRTSDLRSPAGTAHFRSSRPEPAHEVHEVDPAGLLPTGSPESHSVDTAGAETGSPGDRLTWSPAHLESGSPGGVEGWGWSNLAFSICMKIPGTRTSNLLISGRPALHPSPEIFKPRSLCSHTSVREISPESVAVILFPKAHRIFTQGRI